MDCLPMMSLWRAPLSPLIAAAWTWDANEEPVKNKFSDLFIVFSATEETWNNYLSHEHTQETFLKAVSLIGNRYEKHGLLESVTRIQKICSPRIAIMWQTG